MPSHNVVFAKAPGSIWEIPGKGRGCMRRFRVGVVTMEGTPWELEENFDRMEAYVREAARRRAHLVIAPEAILDGYVCGADPDVSEERMVGIAQSVPDGPYLWRGGALAAELGIYLIFGFLERDGEELFNSCALFDPRGEIIAKFSKVHIAGEAFITPGRELKPFDTPLGRVGMLVCQDRLVPENFRTLGVQGAEIVFLTMNGSGGRENTEVLRQRAKDNARWIVVANTWSCAIIDPTGDVYLEKYESECVSVQRVGLGDPTKADLRAGFRRHRRDLYGPLTNSNEDGAQYDERGYPTEAAREVEERHRRFVREHPKM